MMPNPSIEKTLSGKPARASHVKRYPKLVKMSLETF
jgi:hypothetical protein